MDKKIKRKWLTALRSGKYQQTHEKLYRAKPEDGLKAGFCCLGVLAVVQGCPIETLRKSKGQDCPPVKYRAGLNQDDFAELVNQNDGDVLDGKKPKSFNEIAKWIEKHL